jgi:hypothetical protein
LLLRDRLGEEEREPGEEREEPWRARSTPRDEQQR